jgi:Fic family protein
MEEVPTRIEPCLFDDSVPKAVSTLIEVIRARSASLGIGLSTAVMNELCDLVRIANAFHSNLIEGHFCSPDSIAAVLAGEEVEKNGSSLALEAVAHILVQREIDARSAHGDQSLPTSVDYITWVHRRLYERMPSEFCSTYSVDGIRHPIVPGALRSDGDPDVIVGRHQPPSSPRVAVFMEHFAKRYRAASVGLLNPVVSVAAAHHRLNYIHPFPDGNGRVSRLISHALATHAGVGGNGLWSLSRGLAVGRKDAGEYKLLMDYADHPRMGDRDGRGNLSLKALGTFCEWFLSTMVDQIEFSSRLFRIVDLEERYCEIVRSEIASPKAVEASSALIRGGELAASDHPGVVELLKAGFARLRSDNSVPSILFPMRYRRELFPALFEA